MKTLRRPSTQADIADKSYTQNLAINPETLPEASGGDGALTYAISPALPAGLAFDAATRVLSGTPTASQAATVFTYTATDSDTVDPDSASLTFTDYGGGRGLGEHLGRGYGSETKATTTRPSASR